MDVSKCCTDFTVLNVPLDITISLPLILVWKTFIDVRPIQGTMIVVDVRKVLFYVQMESAQVIIVKLFPIIPHVGIALQHKQIQKGDMSTAWNARMDSL